MACFCKHHVLCGQNPHPTALQAGLAQAPGADLGPDLLPGRTGRHDQQVHSGAQQCVYVHVQERPLVDLRTEPVSGITHSEIRWFYIPISAVKSRNSAF